MVVSTLEGEQLKDGRSRGENLLSRGGQACEGDCCISIGSSNKSPILVDIEWVRVRVRVSK